MLVIAKADQTITFGALNDRTFGDAPFSVSASTSAPLEITYSTTGNCTNDGPTVTLTGAGTCTVAASQPGDANYNPATAVSQSFSIAQSGQMIDFGRLADHTYGDGDFSVAATATSGLPVAFHADGSCTVATGTVHLTGAGTCTISASQDGDANYSSAGSVSQQFTIRPGSASITLSGLDATYDGTPKSVVAGTTPSNLDGVTVTYDGSSNPPVNAGSYTVVATLSNANYTAETRPGPWSSRPRIRPSPSGRSPIGTSRPVHLRQP